MLALFVAVVATAKFGASGRSSPTLAPEPEALALPPAGEQVWGAVWVEIDAEVEPGGVGRDPGVRALEVEGPAAAAGLVAGDVLVEVDGQAIRSVEQLQRLAVGSPSRRAFAVVWLREGREMRGRVVPGAR
jgi:serine protease Do